MVPKSVLELTEDYCDECMIGGLGQDLKVTSLLVLLSDCDYLKAKFSDDFSDGCGGKKSSLTSIVSALGGVSLLGVLRADGWLVWRERTDR